MKILIECGKEMLVSVDPELSFSILENPVFNVFEAGGEGGVAWIKTGRDDDGGQAAIG